MKARISDESVREATGRGWHEWFEDLDAAGASAWDHKAIVAHLARTHPEASAWWRQSITVEYERARGKRAVGETTDVGFQLGVQRTVDASVDDVWQTLVSRPELWLGEGASVAFDEGSRYDAAGASGEIRVVKPGERVRRTWQPDDWDAAATIQLTLEPSSAGRTAVHAHLEKLPDAQAREDLRARWRDALERIADAVSR
jgi:uncharacterized protein YndB with AHSA1/START domain